MEGELGDSRSAERQKEKVASEIEMLFDAIELREPTPCRGRRSLEQGIDDEREEKDRHDRVEDDFEIREHGDLSDVVARNPAEALRA
jgi:hypothetical protein